jgi:hypothetical protein
MRRIDLAHDTATDQLPASMRAAMSTVDQAMRMHLDVVGPELEPIDVWDPEPAFGSVVETLQLAATWGRIALNIKAAVRAQGFQGRILAASDSDLLHPRRIDGLTRISTIAERLLPTAGVTWVVSDDERGAPIKVGEDYWFGAAMCWWHDSVLNVAPFGVAERGALPYMPLPIAVTGPHGKLARPPGIHELLVPYPGHEVLSFHDVARNKTKFDQIAALAIRLTFVTVDLLMRAQLRSGTSDYA